MGKGTDSEAGRLMREQLKAANVKTARHGVRVLREYFENGESNAEKVLREYLNEAMERDGKEKK